MIRREVVALVWGRNSEEYQPEKVVVITGPTLGSSLKLILIGALMGSVGTLYLLRQKEEETLNVTDQKERATRLVQRVSDLASRTKDIAQAVTQNLRPQWEEAVDAAKAQAAETEHDLHEEMDDET